MITSVRSATGDDFLLLVRISPIIKSAGITIADSLELATMLSETPIDALHISCWDVFQQVEDDSPHSSTRRFREVLPKELPHISTGAVWSAADAQWLMGEGTLMSQGVAEQSVTPSGQLVWKTLSTVHSSHRSPKCNWQQRI